MALAGWFVCFAVLAITKSWIPFVFFGVALAVVAVRSGSLSRAQLRPSRRSVALGAAGGAAMVVATHLVFWVLPGRAPGIRNAATELIALLNVVGFSSETRAALICAIASCEEILFRGVLLRPASVAVAPGHALPNSQWVRAVTFTAAYALTTLPLGSPLLMVCALLCGGAWAWMYLSTNSLVVPVLAHAIWDLGVLVVWPVVPSGTHG